MRVRTSDAAIPLGVTLVTVAGPKYGDPSG
jgi:hypothetical protein